MSDEASGRTIWTNVRFGTVVLLLARFLQTKREYASSAHTDLSRRPANLSATRSSQPSSFVPLNVSSRTLTARYADESLRVQDSLHNPRWSVHRPTRGWYLRLRRVSLPPSSSESDKPPLPHPDDARLIELRAVKRSKRTRPERSGIELDFRTDTLSFPSSASSSSSFDAQQTRDETRLDMSPTVELFFPTARATSATSTSPTRHRKRPSSVSASPVDPHSSMSANPEPEDPVERPVRQRVMSTFRVRPLARPRAGGVSALFRRVKSLVWEDEPRGFECVWWSSVARQDGAEKASEVEEGEGLDEVEEAERVVLRFVEQPTSCVLLSFFSASCADHSSGAAFSTPDSPAHSPSPPRSSTPQPSNRVSGSPSRLRCVSVRRSARGGRRRGRDEAFTGGRGGWGGKCRSFLEHWTAEG